jgi:radical SAM protein with 4Fe4S-binding SPASM domain
MISELLSGFLVLTYDCNNRCSFCYASPAKFKKDLMDFDRIERYFKLIKSLKIKPVGLIGGEPTLHPQLFEIIKLAKKLEFTITLYTNGRLLSDENFVRKLKDLGLDFVNFSVQSGSSHAKKHNKIVHVDGAWEETKKGIENCHKYGITINIQTVITHTNFDVYKEIIDEFSYANLFIFYREVPPVIPSCRFFNQRVISNNETKTVYKQINMYAKDRHARTYLFSRMPLCWWDERDEMEKEIHGSVVSHCHIINGSNLIIDVDGRVLPCTHYINMHTMNLNKQDRLLSKEEFLSEFNNGIPAQVRKNLTYLPDERCAKCKYYGKRCTGGCPLINFEIGPFVPKNSKVGIE